jgi:hypothetical protein
MGPLKIVKLTDKNTDYPENKKIPRPLPTLPMRALFCASSGSGKTLTIGNMLGRREFGFKNIFKRNIFLFSPTFELDDPSMHGVDINSDNQFSTFDEAAIAEIMEDQKRLIDRWGKQKAPHVLIVLDDLITMLPQSKQSILTRLFFSARHWKISLILTTQSYKATSKAIRLNCSHMIIYKTNNRERDLMGEEQVLDIPLWRSVYNMATSEAYSFLYIDNTKQPKDRYYVRFEDKIVLDDVDQTDANAGEKQSFDA